MTENWEVIELGGKQHLVAAGSRVVVNALATEVGETLRLESIFNRIPVTLRVSEHRRAPKINGLKFKNKVRYLKRYGHRQNQTVLEVVSIGNTDAPKPDSKTVKNRAKKSPVKKVKSNA
jgi:large subunit ribosomal protein L21